MTTYHWTADVSGAWSKPDDWNPDGVPGTGDAAVLGGAGTYTVTIDPASSPVVVDAITLDDAGATLLDTGTLTLSGARKLVVLTAGSLVVAGTINGGTIAAASGSDVIASGGTLNGVAFAGSLDLSRGNSTLTLVGGTTFSGAGGTGAATINFNGGSFQNSDLDVLGTQTLDNVTIDIGNAGFGENYLVNEDTTGTGAVLTLGANLTITQVGQGAALIGSDKAGDGIVNDGTISAGISGGLFDIDATNFTNNGVITVFNGDAIDLTGAPTAALINGIAKSSGGVAQIGGTVTGGTIIAPTGGVGGAGGTLDGVAYQGSLDLSRGNSTLTLTGGTTFSGAGGTGAATINFNGGNFQNSDLDVLGTQTLDNATIEIGNAGFGENYLVNEDMTGTGAVLTLGANLTVTQAGQGAALIGSDKAGDGIVNDGTISAGISGGLFDIDATNFTNNGVITVFNGDAIDLTGAPTAALINGIAKSSGGVAQIGGTVTGGTIIAPTGGVGGAGGTLDGVAVAGTLDLSRGNSTLTLTGGTTFSGAGGTGGATINFNGGNFQNSDLDVLGTQTLDNATIDIGNAGFGDNYIVNEDMTGTGAVLTLGANLTVTQAGQGAALIGSDKTGDGIVNDGTISAGISGGLFDIDATNFTNNGVITVFNGDAIDLTGAPTAALINGIAKSSGGVAQIGGTVTGGTIIAPTGGVGGAGGTLDGVAYQGSLDLSRGNSTLTLTGGTTFSGAGGTGAATINLNGGIFQNSYLDVLGTQTLDNATIDIGNAGFGDNYIVNEDTAGTGAVLTLGANLTITQVGQGAALGGGDNAGDGIVNDGTINAGIAGGLFSINAASFTNNGVITLSNNDTFAFTSTTLPSPPTGAGVIQFAGTATLQIDATPPAASTFGNTLTGLAAGDMIDLRGLAEIQGATAVASGGTLRFADGTTSENFLLGSPGNLDFLVAPDSAGTGTLITAVAACFARGTRIATPGGDTAIEHLRIGDPVRTAAGAVRSIRWIGRRSYAGRFAARNPDILPVVIRAGALGANIPARDLTVSPLHAMFLDGLLIPAIHLVNGASITQQERIAQIDYFHIELDTHDVLLAEGAPSESFVDDDSRGIFHNARDYDALYPDAPRVPAFYCAPRVTAGFALAAIRARLAVRAGLRPPGAPMPLRGYLDRVGATRVQGWAQNPARPEVPVCLDVLVDGAVVAQTLANQFRPDLRAAGFGGGHHGFSLSLPTPLTPSERESVVVRRSSDQAALPRSFPPVSARAA